MTNRTYIPTLHKLLKVIQKFIGVNKTRLEASLGETGYALLVACLEAIDILITFLEVETYPASDTLILQD